MRNGSRILLASILFAVCAAHGAEIPAEFQVKREAVFEFAAPPKVTRSGDRIEVAFEAKGRCDVTVAIEDADGNIVRHLASGVLGNNAPAPFQKDSLAQRIVWDGKDDLDKYIDDKDSHIVRVSLGLKPQFERTLFWSPYKRIGSGTPVLAAAPEGMYILEGHGVSTLRLFGHDGGYLRTIYPFPANKLSEVQGLNLQEFPQDGQKLPVKIGPKHASSLFTTGGANERGNDKGGSAGIAMAVQGKKIALISHGLSRLATDGSSGGVSMSVPDVTVPVNSGGKIAASLPHSAALSPDGRWLYLAGYYGKIHAEFSDWLHCVMRLDYANGQKLELFAGSLKPRDAGTDNAHFNVPCSVTCDPEGNVYVADYLNDRIQIFTPEGKYLKSIKAVKPVQIGIHFRTKEIYVGSWMLSARFHDAAHAQAEATLTRLKSTEDPTVLASYPLPLNGYSAKGTRWGGFEYKLAFDFYADPPVTWLLPGMTYSIPSGSIVYRDDLKGASISLLVEKDGKLVLQRDFNDDVVKNPMVVRARAAGGGPAGPRQRLYVNPKTGKLYEAEFDCGDGKAFNQVAEFDAKTGNVKFVTLPMASEDMAIDLNGLFYLRSDVDVGRFELAGWREVPWDYGEERGSAGFGSTGARYCRLVSSLALPSTGRPGWWHLGGMAVSPKGHLAVTCYNTSQPADRRLEKTLGSESSSYSRAGYQAQAGKYKPHLYPGRATGWETHVWDRHGKVIFEDALAGIGVTDGIGLDKDDNLYVMVNGNRVLNGKPYFLPWGETYLKVKAGKMHAITAGNTCPVPAEGEALPKRPADMVGVWAEGAEWFYGGVGFAGWASGSSCICWNTRPALDLFERSFLPEIDHYSVAVLDTNGNLIMRIGKYGNVEDGRPLMADGGPENPRSIGGDEVALFHAAYVGTHSDRRLFISDGGNSRILSVKLGYHATERVALKDVPETAHE